MSSFLSSFLHSHSTFRIFGFSAVVSILAFSLVGITSGLEALFSVMVLAVIEVTFSFENAVVNAKVLQKMHRIWQTIFLTIGIFIAVFGMRMILPLVLVGVTADLSISTVLDLALHDPDEYAHHLEVAHPIIAAFGGVFLLMIFLHFLFEDREIHWLQQIERPLRRLNIGWIGPLAATIAALLLAAAVFAGDHFGSVMTAGLTGMGVFLAVKILSERFQKSGESQIATGKNNAKFALKTGLFSFIYLELLDASFSFDGVVAAFAITKNVLLIAVGLGVGAVFVRSMTIFLMRRGTLAHYIYLEHGAYYAVGALATFMLIGIGYEVPSFITGIAGVSIIGLAIAHSKQHNAAAAKKNQKAAQS